MARQPKQKHECPECGQDLKRTIGARSRKKFWECLNCGWRRRVDSGAAKV